MRRLPSIRKKISTYAVMGLLGLGIFFILAVATNGIWQRHLSVQKLEAEMLATTQDQAKRILGTILLPEERSALPAILDRIKSQEGLLAISVNQFGKYQVKNALGCRPITRQSSICSDRFDQEVRTLSRLEHDGRVYAELSKTKSLPTQSWISFADPQLWFLLFAGLTLAGVMHFVLRFIQKDLCDSVQEIVTGLEQGPQARKNIIKKQSYRELRHLAKAMFGLQNQVERKSLKESLGEMSRQVAHDMRSPLSLLKVVTASSDHPMTDAEKRLAAQAARRLEQIADTLLNKSENKETGFDTLELSRMIESLIDEKSYQYGGRIQFIFDNKLNKAVQLSSKPETVLRTLSNLLDNSAEAIEGQAQGTVRLSISYDDKNDVVVDILDTGIGFDAAVYPTQSSKKFGHGLGVKAARKDLTKQNGALAYNSLVGAGTATRIRIS